MISGSATKARKSRLCEELERWASERPAGKTTKGSTTSNGSTAQNSSNAQNGSNVQNSSNAQNGSNSIGAISNGSNRSGAARSSPLVRGNLSPSASGEAHNPQAHNPPAVSSAVSGVRRAPVSSGVPGVRALRGSPIAGERGTPSGGRGGMDVLFFFVLFCFFFF
ncbi:hypothetical protein T484DRAFT_1856853 [Baffinella frigidus]|nr:hypothetical protein T484DRAFT_1856853 [Cryptophyta sp. CCMP2293]